MTQSSAVDFAIRVAVFSAIAIAFYFVRGFGSRIEIAAMALVASLASHGTAMLVRALRERSGVPKLAIALMATAVVVAGAGLVVLLARPHAPEYRMVDELGDPADRIGDELKLHGYVELGSLIIDTIDQESVRTFRLQRNGRGLRVRAVGPVPDTLKERAEVIALGRIERAADGQLELVASELIAKCPTTYETRDGPKPASQFR